MGDPGVAKKGIQTAMKRALITGVTGQDGAYLSKFLLDKGYRIYGVSRDTREPNVRNLNFLGIENGIELSFANLVDLSNVIRLLEQIRPDEVYNLASQSSVSLSFDQPKGLSLRPEIHVY